MPENLRNHDDQPLITMINLFSPLGGITMLTLELILVGGLLTSTRVRELRGNCAVCVGWDGYFIFIFCDPALHIYSAAFYTKKT